LAPVNDFKLAAIRYTCNLLKPCGFFRFFSITASHHGARAGKSSTASTNANLKQIGIFAGLGASADLKIGPLPNFADHDRSLGAYFLGDLANRASTALG
jgi:hypothetical protein